jgi:hypothetical protein
MKMAAAAVYARQERNALKREEGWKFSLSYYLLYYISNKVDKLGWKKKREDGE